MEIGKLYEMLDFDRDTFEIRLYEKRIDEDPTYNFKTEMILEPKDIFLVMELFVPKKERYKGKLVDYKVLSKNKIGYLSHSQCDLGHFYKKIEDD